MDLRTLLAGFLAWILYPAWLLAGAADYLCHRRTHIELTSGRTESWLHVAQFGCIAIAFALAVALQVTAFVWILMIAAVLAHSVLAFIDVSYTSPRRDISPLEQHVHGYMDVLPLMAVCLIGVLNWPEIRASDSLHRAFRWKDPGTPRGELSLLLGSFAVLAGIPVVEELVRTLRCRVVDGESHAVRMPAAPIPPPR